MSYGENRSESNPELQQFEDNADSGGAATASELFGFAIRAARRHLWLSIFVASSILLVGLSLAQFIPRKYHSRSRIMLDESAAKVTVLSSPERAFSNMDPLSGALELLMQKTMLEALVDEVDLIPHWEATRTLPFRLKDAIVAAVLGEPSRDDKREALGKMLATNMFPDRDKNIVSISVIWNDPRMSETLAKHAQQKLIDILQRRENATYLSAIGLLEEQVERARDAIEPAAAELGRAREKAGFKPIGAVAAVSPGPRVERPDESRAGALATPEPRLSARLAEFEAKIQAIEQPWRRRQAELESRLSELKTVYGAEHPMLVQHGNLVKAAAEPPAELVQLRQARAELLSQIQSPHGSGDGRSDVSNVRIAAPVTGERALGLSEEREREREESDPTVAAALAGVRTATDKYTSAMQRLESARQQFTTAQVAMERMLVVIEQPEAPRKPTSPIGWTVSGVAVGLALLLGFLTGAMRDLLSGKVYEPWQLRPLGLQTVGELWLFGTTAGALPRKARGA
ncbi:MAG TPA: hypothetical protein VKP30_17640 [Polyangiaceae bacterium]|nr:hypothetical protein [Polyangiaceae bacterium]